MLRPIRIRRVLGLLSFFMVGYVSLAGCGDDDAGPITDAPDTGVDSARPDTSSTTDTSTSDVTADSRTPEQTGSACATVNDCYQGFDAQSLKGAPFCIDKVSNGYCTHECQADTDCCAVPGECKTNLKQVCAPFENTNKKYCFLSCEDSDIAAANDAGASDAGTDGANYCKKNASTEFGCRSTGGGAGNRKVCLPTGGGPNDGGTDASDASDANDAADAPDGD